MPLLPGPALIAATNLIVFNSILGVDTASIDTGASSIPGGYQILEVFIIARTDNAGPGDRIDITVNNDTGANYDQQILDASNTTVAAQGNLAQAHWNFDTNAGGTAAYAGICILTFVGYSGTSFNKVGTMFAARMDATAGNNTVFTNGIGWRNTAAITRIKIAAESTNKLKAGSQLLVMAR